MAKTTKRAASKAKPKTPRAKQAQDKLPPALDTASETAPETDKKNQQLAAWRASLPTPQVVRESHAKTDAERFIELCAIPLPQKIAGSLTDKQRSFCYEVFRDGIQEAAFRRAGYSAKHAARHASALMEVLGVRVAIDWLADAATAQDESSVEWIVRQLREVYQTCRAAVQVLDRNGKPTGDYRIDSAGALRALELIGKARGIFTQTVKHEHSGSITHLLQAISGTGKPQLEERAPIDVTPSATGEAAQQKEDETV